MSKRETAQDRVDRIVARALELGYESDDQTRREEVRTFGPSEAYGYAPRLMVSGGRARFKRGYDRLTVGPRTICFYRRDPERPEIFYTYLNGYGAVGTFKGDGVGAMTCVDTRDVDAAIAELERRAAAAPEAGPTDA